LAAIAAGLAYRVYGPQALDKVLERLGLIEPPKQQQEESLSDLLKSWLELFVH
jgi:hypothetical protein